MPQHLSVLLNNIRSLYNVGSIFRTADGAGVSKLYLCGYTGAPPRREIDKTSLGASEYIPWEHHKDAFSLLKKLKKEGTQIVALERTDESVDYRTFTPKFSCCLVLGHEIIGVDEKIIALADAVIHIPMRGKKESLNVATAFGIAVYRMLG